MNWALLQTPSVIRSLDSTDTAILNKTIKGLTLNLFCLRTQADNAFGKTGSEATLALKESYDPAELKAFLKTSHTYSLIA